jgi:predicted Mrr-cat superfamily restriction endonuclease
VQVKLKLSNQIICIKVKREQGENGVQRIKRVLIVIDQKDFLKNNIVNMAGRTGPLKEIEFKIDLNQSQVLS